MAEEVRLWHVDGKRLHEIEQAKLDLEGRLEDWLADDITLLSDDLLVIGRQEQTDFGGIIDLLCLDANGDAVIVELKKHKTPREVTAQALDYASWVQNLSHERISAIAQEYLGKRMLGEGSLEQTFMDQFDAPLPDVLNGEHRILIVAAEIDPSSERIVRYLSDTHGISINVATFQFFREDDGRELLARTFLLEPEEVESRTQARGGSKRKRLTREQLQEVAEEHGVGEIYRQLVERLDPFFSLSPGSRGAALKRKYRESKRSIVTLYPADSNEREGLYFTLYTLRLQEVFGFDEETLRAMLPVSKEAWRYSTSTPGKEWAGYEGYFRTPQEVEVFADAIEQAVLRPN